MGFAIASALIAALFVLLFGHTAVAIKHRNRSLSFKLLVVMWVFAAYIFVDLTIALVAMV